MELRNPSSPLFAPLFSSFPMKSVLVAVALIVALAMYANADIVSCVLGQLAVGAEREVVGIK